MTAYIAAFRPVPRSKGNRRSPRGDCQETNESLKNGKRPACRMSRSRATVQPVAKMRCPSPVTAVEPLGRRDAGPHLVGDVTVIIVLAKSVSRRFGRGIRPSPPCGTTVRHSGQGRTPGGGRGVVRPTAENEASDAPRRPATGSGRAPRGSSPASSSELWRHVDTLPFGFRERHD